MTKRKEGKGVCPVCLEEKLQAKSGAYKIRVKDGNKEKEITVKDLTWRECDKCGEVVLGDEAARRIEEERYKALGLLSPIELKETRKELGLTQEAMAQFLAVGNKTYCRWENGFSMQTKSMDLLIRLAVNEKARQKEREQRLERAISYLDQLRKSRAGNDKKELSFSLAAHSKNMSKAQLREIGKKVFKKKQGGKDD